MPTANPQPPGGLVGVGISPQPGLTQPFLHRHPRERGDPESRASWSCPARFAALAVPSISPLVMLDSRVRGERRWVWFSGDTYPYQPRRGGGPALSRAGAVPRPPPSRSRAPRRRLEALRHRGAIRGDAPRLPGQPAPRRAGRGRCFSERLGQRPPSLHRHSREGGNPSA